MSVRRTGCRRKVAFQPEQRRPRCSRVAWPGANNYTIRVRAMKALVLVTVLAVVCSDGAARADSTASCATATGHRAKVVDTSLPQTRTHESDEAFRKNAPPLGSVRLSNRAFTLLRSFMREVRRAMPEGDQIAWIGWVKDQAFKRPNDTNWTSIGSGWVLGSYSRAQLPPDVIDKIRGVEIVFSTDVDAPSLTGKTIDVTRRKFFVRD